MSGIIIWAETKNGELRKPVLETITAARKIVGETGNVHAVVVGDANIAEMLASYPLTTVQLVEGDQNYQSEAFTDAMFSCVTKTSSDMVIIAATTLGRDLSARLAARINAVLATDVTEIKTDNGLKIMRPVYSGKLL
ncbi:hypothetical protein K8T06_08540, partial [bacterium]|nr:hypothetical protein [bacterium]